MFFDQIFLFLNSAILVGVFYIAYRQYVRPRIISELQKKSAEKKQSILQKNDLIAQLKIIAKQRNDRELSYRNLSEKVLQWRRMDEAILAQRAQDIERIKLSIENREKEQHAHMIEMRINARVIPQALAKARLELYDHFHEDGVGEMYINQIFANLKKDLHCQRD